MTEGRSAPPYPEAGPLPDACRPDAFAGSTAVLISYFFSLFSSIAVLDFALIIIRYDQAVSLTAIRLC